METSSLFEVKDGRGRYINLILPICALKRYNEKYDELVWKETVLEREYTVDDLAVFLKKAGLIIKLCTQDFYGDGKPFKWKIIAEK